MNGAPGVHERRVDLVADHRRAEARGEVGEGGEALPRVHGAGGVVRVAQQHRARAAREGGLDAEQIELPPGLGVDERHALDDARPPRGCTRRTAGRPAV